MLNKTDESGSLTSSTEIIDDENDNISFFLKLLLSSAPSSIKSPFHIGLNLWTIPKPLFS